MAVSIKISEDNVKLLNKLQEDLRKESIKVSQKYLIDRAIKFSLKEYREDFVKMLKMKTIIRKVEGEKLLKEFLDSKVRIKGDILKEHDIIL